MEVQVRIKGFAPGLCSPLPNKQCFGLRKRDAAVKRLTPLLTLQGSQRTQHLDLCVYINVAKQYLYSAVINFNSNPIHLVPLHMAEPYRHATN